MDRDDMRVQLRAGLRALERRLLTTASPEVLATLCGVDQVTGENASEANRERWASMIKDEVGSTAEPQPATDSGVLIVSPAAAAVIAELQSAAS